MDRMARKQVPIQAGARVTQVLPTGGSTPLLSSLTGKVSLFGKSAFGESASDSPYFLFYSQRL